MPTKLSREQADVIINMLEGAKNFELAGESIYGNIFDEEIQNAVKTDKEVITQLQNNSELEVDKQIDDVFTPLEIAISTNNKEAFDILISSGADVDILNTESVSMLGIAFENYTIQESNSKKESEKADSAYMTKELIKRSSLEILEGPFVEGMTILYEIASFDGQHNEMLYKESLDRLKELPSEAIDEFALIADHNGENVFHKLHSEDDLKYAEMIAQQLSTKGIESALTAKSTTDETPKDLISDDKYTEWYNKTLNSAKENNEAEKAKILAEKEEKAKAFEKELLEELKNEEDKKEQEDKKAEKNRRKKEKQKLRKKQKQQSEEAVTGEEPSKESKKKVETVANETPQTEQVTKEEPKPAFKEKEEVKPEATKLEVKEETNEQLYQRFADAVLGDASLTKIGNIQKEINKRDDRKGFDEFLAITSESGSIGSILIDTIETDPRFRNEKGSVSSRSQKIEFFIDPELKQQIKPKTHTQDSVTEEQQPATQVSTDTAQSSPETVATEQRDAATSSPSTKGESIEEAEAEAQRPLIPANRVIRELSKYNRQLTREKADLVGQVRQKDEALRYQSDEITRLNQQLYTFSQENQSLRAQNHNLYVQTQSQAGQINELLENNLSLQAAVQESQRTFQERYASRGAFDPSELVQQRNEMNLATQAIANGENFSGTYFSAEDGKLVNMSVSQESKGNSQQK